MTVGTAEPWVTLAHGGQLRGLWEEGVRVFRGMQYALAPRGALRFAAPVPALPWSGVRDAACRVRAESDRRFGARSARCSLPDDLRGTTLYRVRKCMRVAFHQQKNGLPALC